MKNKTYFYCIPLILLVVFSSCEKDFEQPFVSQTKQPNFTEGQIHLGKQLENPYSVENMQKAWDNIATPTMRSAMSEVPTTHLYLKFKPQDEEQLSILKNDTSIIWYDYPLDYEMPEEGGSYYHDPEVPLDQPTYHYTAVSIDHPLPQGVEYELLANLYIPEEQEEESGARLQEQEWIDELVDEALRLTDNLEPIAKDSQGVNAKRWRPSGTIKVWDDVKSGYVPVKGAKVRARRWFTTSRGTTNSTGYFSGNKTFKRPAKYSIIWERVHWNVRAGTYSQAYYNGPKKKANWNLNIRGGHSLRYATIHRAAHRYFYEGIGGLKRPGIPTTLNLCYYNGEGTGVNWGNIPYYVLPNIKIWGKHKNGSYKTTELIFRTSIHELAHASHINLMGGIIQYAQVDITLYESWADCIEWYITTIEYENLEEGYDKPSLNKQDWSGSFPYTSLFIDILDKHNQNSSSVNDNLEWGCSIGKLESQVVKYSYGISSLKTRLKANSCLSNSDTEINNFVNQFVEQ